MKRLFSFIITYISFCSFCISQEIVFSGKVVDENGNALPYVSIQVLNTNYGTTTNEDGSFIISGLLPGEYTISFSEIGYAGKIISLSSAEGTDLTIRLEESTLQLGEVVVQSQKRHEELQHVPMAITSVNAQRVAELQIDEIGEVGRIAPNIISLNDGGGFLPLVASRGVATIDDVPVLGVYVDDVPLFNIASFPTSMTDVQSIEVLRGPQGTLYGRNSLAGVINIRTQPPGNQKKGLLSVGYGNLNQYSVEGAFSTPIIKDKLFMRFNANTTGRDGFIDNPFLNSSRMYGREVYGGNLRLSYLPSDSWSYTLSTNNEYSESFAYAFLVGSGERLDSIKNANPYNISLNSEGPYKILSSNNAFKASFDGSKFQFDAITAFQYTATDREDEDLDYSALELVSRSLEVRDLTFSEELRFSSVGNGKLDWVGGVYLYYVNNDNDLIFTQGPDNALFAPDSIPSPEFPYDQINETTITQTGVSFFGHLTAELTDRLSASVGLRYEIERSELTADIGYERSGEPYEFPPLGLLPASFNEDATFDALSPKLGLDYQIKEDMLAYATVARGYRPGGVNPLVNDPDLATFEPEFSWNYEIGLKSRFWKQRAQLNMAAFYLQYSDQQLFTALDLSTLSFGRNNAGNSYSYGLEIESEFLLVKGLSVNINGGYLQTEFTDYNVTTFSGEADFEGNTVPYAPEWNGSVGATYRKIIAEDVILHFAVDYQYQSELFFDPGNTASQEAYGLLNTRLAFSRKQMELAFWAKNLTDVVYFDYGFGGAGFNNQVSYGLPRTYGSSLTYRFGS